MTPEVSSCAVRVKVTDVEVVEAAPLFIWIEPVGAVLSSFMLSKVLCVSSLPSVSKLQYSSVLSSASLVISGCPSTLTLLVSPSFIL